MSAASAHARPNLAIGEAGARAGDVVHFTVSGLDGDTSYEVEVDDEWVMDGWGDGVISDTFTMPDLGAGSWIVTLRVTLRSRKKMSGELQYLGRALPVVKAPAPAPAAPDPTVAAQPASAPAISSPKAVEGPSPPAAVTPQSSPLPHRSYEQFLASQRLANHGEANHGKAAHQRTHRKAAHRKAARTQESRRATHRKHAHRTRHSARWFARAWLRAFRAAPYPVPPHHSGASGPGDGGRIFSLNAIAPQAAALAATAARAGSGGPTAAIVVPALLALAALTLAGTAIWRRRRLATRSARD